MHHNILEIRNLTKLPLLDTGGDFLTVICNLCIEVIVDLFPDALQRVSAC